MGRGLTQMWGLGAVRCEGDPGEPYLLIRILKEARAEPQKKFPLHKTGIIFLKVFRISLLNLGLKNNRQARQREAGPRLGGWEVADFLKKPVAADCLEPSCLWGVSAPWLAGLKIFLYFGCLKSNTWKRCTEEKTKHKKRFI